jgi:hypothetical protein
MVGLLSKDLERKLDIPNPKQLQKQRIFLTKMKQENAFNFFFCKSLIPKVRIFIQVYGIF